MFRDGIKQYDGIVISTREHFDYYAGSTGDKCRAMLMKASRPWQRVQTLKSDFPVKVANNKVSVLIYPDGKVEITPSVDK